MGSKWSGQRAAAPLFSTPRKMMAKTHHLLSFTHLYLVAWVPTVTEKPRIPDVFLQVGQGMVPTARVKSSMSSGAHLHPVLGSTRRQWEGFLPGLTGPWGPGRGVIDVYSWVRVSTPLLNWGPQGQPLLLLILKPDQTDRLIMVQDGNCKHFRQYDSTQYDLVVRLLKACKGQRALRDCSVSTAAWLKPAK